MNAGSIDAVLTLNSTGFVTGIKTSLKALNKFKDAEASIDSLNGALIRMQDSMKLMDGISNKNVETFNRLANAIHKMSLGLEKLQGDTINVEQGINTMNSIFKAFQGTLSSTTLKIENVSMATAKLLGEMNKESQAVQRVATATQQYGLHQTNVKMATVSASESLSMYHQHLKALALGIEQFNAFEKSATSTTRQFTTVLNPVSTYLERMNSALIQNRNSVMAMITGQEEATASLERNSQAMRRNGAEQLRNMGYTGRLSAEEEKLSASTTRATSSVQRQSVANRSATASTNQLSSATSRLGKAMSSLRMMGSLVGSMLAYNFAHKLLVATGETIHAKSEMEGYFKMLHLGQDEVLKFNNALDQTVQRFQRVNKYSLGETISSIGVEFNLTTDEMIKAMDVTSMITSEYLRAGRNANEASLAVKDVLQGQFQRLSRETGVKGEQLKEAGWNGDVTDVESLLDALRKVGEARHWDVFAEKANSINDILTILQNRFGEWSAEMVNIVQPSIVNAFNAIMTVMGGFSNILGGVWEWLNTDGWGQTAVKIGAVGTALLTVSEALVMYRTGMGLAQASQLGFTKTLASVVLGLKGQEIAEHGVYNAIMSKIMGVKASTLAEKGMTMAIKESILQRKLETIEDKINSASKGENTVASKLNAVEKQFEKAQTEGLIVAKEKETIEEEINTATKELNTLASIEQTGANTGLTASLYLLGTGEELATGATIGLSEAMGILNGVFMLSPIGWITAGILALAGAVYVLTGGLDDLWGSLQRSTDAVENSAEAMKPYKDYVEQTNQELQDAKQKYGENSLIVEQLSKKYDNAKNSLDAYYKKLQSTTLQHETLNQELSVTSAKMDEIMRTELGDLGYDQSQIDEMTTGVSDLDRLWDHDYVARQKHNKMLGNFSNDIHDYAELVGKDAEAIKEYGKTYSDFIHYSDEANNADNWWDWATNSFMAGLSSDSMKFQELIHGSFDSTFGDSIAKEWLDGIGNWINGIGDQWNNYWNNLDLAGSINNAWKGVSDWVQSFDLGKTIGDWLSSLPDPSADFGEWLAGAWANFGTSVQGFFDDPLGSMGITLPEGWSILSLLGFNTVSATDGSETPTFMEDLSSILGFNIQTWLNNFQADPMGTLGIDLSGFNIGSFISTLFPSDGGVSILNWVNTSIIQPMTLGIQNGIASIPIIGDIAQMLGLVPQQDQNAFTTGYNLIDNLKRGVEQKISEIPIIGDIAQMLGLIPQQNSNAHDKGQGVGENIKQGEKQGQTGTAQNVASEMGDVITAISNSVGKAFSTAQQVGSAIWGGINSILQRHSPGFIHDQVQAEFGTDIPNAILSGGDSAYANAQYYGQQISDGISSVNLNSFGTFATDYESDAQMINATTQMMGMDTTTAFNDMSMAVNSTTSSMGANVTSTYTSMQTKQSSMLNTMKTQNTSAYNDMYQKSNQSLIHMRDSTSNITHQMTNAWNTMKNNIVQSAHQLQHDSTVHFNTLSNTIGGFYRKIQNPSSWGGSPHGGSTHRNVSAGRRIASSFTGGRKYSGGRGSTYTGDKTMTIAQLKRKICPNGDCNGIFDGWSSTDVVDVRSFLSLVEDGGFGSWSDWHNTHYSHIKNKSDQWGMKSPTINLVGGIPTNANYKVGDFENGTPKISFSSFQSMAESIFSEIPYRFYYNSDWKGSWLGALQAGACNCWDGANALLAFAQSCGFGGGIQHGTWVDPDGTSYPHVYAVINGKKMDTTGWQQRRSWSAGSPTARVGNATRVKTSNDNTNVSPTIIVNINEPVYGVDDLDSKITDGVDKGLQRHFNKSYAIGI